MPLAGNFDTAKPLRLSVNSGHIASYSSFSKQAHTFADRYSCCYHKPKVN